MKKLLAAALAACLILTMTSCINISAEQLEALGEIDLNEVAEQLNLNELAEQLNLDELISQFVPGMDTGADAEAAPEIPEGAITDPEQMTFKTIGEAMKAGETLGSCIDAQYYVYVVDYEGEPIRVAAESTEELYEAATSLDGLAEDFNEKFEALVADLPIVREENLNDYRPDPAVLDELIGKTGKDLLDAGYEFPCFADDDKGQWIQIEKGLFTYCMKVEEEISYDIVEENFESLTVKSIEFEGLSGYATDLTVTAVD